MVQSATIQLNDQSSTGEARRTGQRLGSRLGLNEVKNGELSIIITEAARNVVVHASGGHLVVSTFRSTRGLQADVLALDKGPGIKDLSRAFEDGYSSNATPGSK